MARRRQFGSVRKLESGRWQARYKVVGGRSITAPNTFLTKGDAGRWLAGIEADRARGVWVDPDAGKVLLDAYAWRWWRSQVGLAKRTREIYETQLRLHVLPVLGEDLPALGEVALADLTPELIRQWYATLARERTSSVAAKAYTRLRQILGRAVDEERIAKNPCRIERGGVERHAEQRFASMSELYELAAAVPDAYRALVLTAGLAGLRMGELSGLRWRDVDLDDATITVRRKRLRLASGEVIEEGPKSDVGRRTVALPATLVDELEQHRATHRAEAGDDDYVFVSPTGEPMERSNFRYRVWVPATRAVGLEGLRFHDLRHTAGTLAARTGATTKELMARLGHASPRASLIYQHASEDRDRRVAERLDEMAEEADVDRAERVTDRDGPSRSGTEVARQPGRSRGE
jgi:integrase